MSDENTPAPPSPPKKPRGRPVGWKAPLYADLTEFTLEDFSFVRAVISGLEATEAYKRFYGHRDYNPDGTPHIPHGHTINAKARELREKIAVTAEKSGSDDMRRAVEMLRMPLPELEPDEATAPPSPALPSHAQHAQQAQLVPPSFEEWFSTVPEDHFMENELPGEYERFKREWYEEHAPSAAAQAPSPTLSYEEFEASTQLHALPMRERIERFRKYLSDEGLSEAAVQRKVAPVIRGWITDRQVASLNAIQTTLSVAPTKGAPLIQWLARPIVEILNRSGLQTIEDLHRHINQRGQGWANKMDGLGRVRAQKLLDWLQFHSESLNLKFDTHAPQWQKGNPLKALTAQAPSSPLLRTGTDGVFEATEVQAARASGIAPLELLQVPPELDGSHGEFRTTGPNQLGANNDMQAVLIWLQSYKDGAQIGTYRIYKRELERFYIWCLRYGRVALSSVTLAHALAYQQFLKDIPDELRTEDRVPQSDARWRPWRGQFNAKSQAYSLGVIRQFYNSMIKGGYIKGNPFDAVKSVTSRSASMDTTRSLDQNDLAWLASVVHQLSDEVQTAEDALPYPPVKLDRSLATKRRLVTTFQLLLTTGMRLSEVVNAKFKLMAPAKINGVPQVDEWMLNVTGKGKKTREVPIRGHVYKAIERHHADALLGLELANGADSERVKAFKVDPPLICALMAPAGSKHKEIDDLAVMAHHNLSLSAAGLYRMLTRFFQSAAKGEIKAAKAKARAIGADIARAKGLGLAAIAADLENKKAAAEQEVAVWARRARMTTHWLRHTFATEMLRANSGDEGLKVLQQLLGHASISTTAEYLKQDESSKVQAVQRINPLGI